MTRWLKAAGVAGLLLPLFGSCTTYRVLAFGDHPSGKVTRLETLKLTDYWVTASATHQFWLCEDNGNALSCERKCGDGTDVACPTAAATAGGITTNTR